jgi:hypothetical protein
MRRIFCRVGKPPLFSEGTDGMNSDFSRKFLTIERDSVKAGAANKSQFSFSVHFQGRTRLSVAFLWMGFIQVIRRN